MRINDNCEKLSLVASGVAGGARFYFAQTIKEAKAAEIRHEICVDNIGIIGLEPSSVESMQVEIVSRFNTAGLRVHVVETDKFSAELLGVHLGLEQHPTRITNSRHWKVRLGPNASPHRAKFVHL